MKTHYTDLFIDFDDTLYDTHGNAVIALARLFEHYGWQTNFDNPDIFYTNYWETNVKLWRQYALGEIERSYLMIERFRRPLSLGSGIDLSDQHMLEVSDCFLSFCSVMPGVVPGAHELVRYLKEQGYRLHICSNGFHEVQYRKLRACGLFDYFDTIILSEDAGANKPSQQFFDYALRQTGADKATTLMIGDNFDTDIMGAKGVGLDTMFFNPHPEKVQASASVSFEVHALAEIQQIL